MSRETAQEIDLQAADWAARVDRGLSPDEERALDLWLAEDHRRLGAYGKVRAIAVHTERARALAPHFDPANFQPRSARLPVSRRRLLAAGGGAIAASAAGLVVVGLAAGQRYNTRLGEVKVTPLADGSVMTLNTASRVVVSFSDTQRSIQLIEGEALFDVARDPARPFLVVAGEARVRAVGTSFTVRRLGDAPVEVLVREGIVEVSRGPAAAGGRPLRVAANTRAVASSSSAAPVATMPVEPGLVRRELAWREGRIAFEGETLAEAAAQFSRYSETRIMIDDPAIAAEEITGLYQANDPVGFAQAVASSFGLRVAVGAGEVRLSGRPRDGAVADF
ncbi:MAG: FecR domain-containing protein [Pseudomonadota bacterium]|nr:FecR domain-containing protein [Pseudomonadota bacterium]